MNSKESRPTLFHDLRGFCSLLQRPSGQLEVLPGQEDALLEKFYRGGGFSLSWEPSNCLLLLLVVDAVECRGDERRQAYGTAIC